MDGALPPRHLDIGDAGRFQAVNRLVLGAMVAEEALDMSHPGDQRDVAQEHPDAEGALEEVPR